ncbi:MAG: hypothetical protein V3W34_03650 [Phycisphaerae bacterium]
MSASEDAFYSLNAPTLEVCGLTDEVVASFSYGAKVPGSYHQGPGFREIAPLAPIAKQGPIGESVWRDLLSKWIEDSVTDHVTRAITSAYGQEQQAKR